MADPSIIGLCAGAFFGLYLAFAMHEAGHAIAARMSGLPVAGIKIGAGPGIRFGLHSFQIDVRVLPWNSHAAIGPGQVTPRAAIMVLLAGVGVNLACAAAFFAAFYGTKAPTWLGLALASFSIGAVQFIEPASDIRRAIAVYRLVRERRGQASEAIDYEP